MVELDIIHMCATNHSYVISHRVHDRFVDILLEVMASVFFRCLVRHNASLCLGLSNN
jgi:hypothetical protein